MGRLRRFLARIPLTSGERTLLSFLVLVSLAGFFYLEFFGGRGATAERAELLALQARADSLERLVRARRLGELQRSIDRQRALPLDSLPTLAQVIAADPPADSAPSRPERERRKAPVGPVNINQAPKERLVDLPGIGEKTAEKIIEYRRHTPFRRLEDLMEVKGIGEKKLEKIRPHVTLK